MIGTVSKAKPLSPAQRERLQVLIKRIEDALDVTAAPLDKHLQQSGAATVLLAALVSEKLATISCSYGTAIIRMAGVTSSSTAQTLGLLRNWQAAARKRIEGALS